MNTVCDKDRCVGCRACFSICPSNAITINEDSLSIQAIIDDKKCINCGSCVRVCVGINSPILKAPNKWSQGWSINPNRLISSSGGLAYEIINGFIIRGGSAYSCVFQNGQFMYRKVKDSEDLKNFIGSKYVKSNPGNVYRDIKRELSANKDVLFLGLPCHVQAVKNYCNTMDNRLYTVDLICHGTPSYTLFKQYIIEEEIDINSVKLFTFRDKDLYRLEHDKSKVSSCDCFDYWMVPFLRELTFTENCYNCRFACFDRCSDLTIGDSWGSTLPVYEQKKGISLALIMNEKGEELLANSKVYMENVDIDNALLFNSQLNCPANRPDEREEFVKELRNGYKSSIIKIYRGEIIKKTILSTWIGRLCRTIRNSFKYKERK